MVTWTDRDSFAMEVGEEIKMESDVWVTAVPEVKNFASKIFKYAHLYRHAKCYTRTKILNHSPMLYFALLLINHESMPCLFLA